MPFDDIPTCTMPLDDVPACTVPFDDIPTSSMPHLWRRNWNFVAILNLSDAFTYVLHCTSSLTDPNSNFDLLRYSLIIIDPSSVEMHLIRCQINKNETDYLSEWHWSSLRY